MVVFWCSVCGKSYCPSPAHSLRIWGLPVLVGSEVVFKRFTLCKGCGGAINEEITKWLPIKKAEIVTKFLKARGVKLEGLEDYEGYIK